MPAMTGTFASVKAQSDNPALIRKSLEIVWFLAPMSAAVPTTLFAADGTLTIPDKYLPGGVIDPKGITIDGKTEKDEVNSLGYANATRVDVVKVAKSIKVTAQERYKQHIESVIAMQDLSKVAPKAATGELVWDEVTVPVSSEYRLLVVSRDVYKPTGDDILEARCFTRVSVSDAPSDNFVEKGARDAEITFDVLTDTAVGTPCRRIYGGKGFAALTPVLGYAAAA